LSRGGIFSIILKLEVREKTNSNFQVYNHVQVKLIYVGT